MMLRLLAVVAFVSGCQAWLWPFGGSSPAWNDLKITYGLPLVSFTSQPRTSEAAIKAGWTLDATCSKSAGFRGNRYVKGGDRTVMLLYDKNGYIVGIQASLSKTMLSQQRRNFPSYYIKKYFVDEASSYTITAYFVNPGTVDICREGRSESQFQSEGTGNGLWIQMGRNPETDLMTIPMQETGLLSTKWTKGKCFYGMGVHYWYNIREDMDCDKFVPFFIMYNSGKLNAFGWAFNADLSSSKYEHPPPSVFSRFLKPVPKCLLTAGRISTLHIYMDSTPLLNFC